MNRDTVILKASREFDDNKELTKLTTRADHVNLALRDAGFGKLTSEET